MAQQEPNEILKLSDDEVAMILAYQKISGATSLKNAVLNAVSLALDHTDDNNIIDAISSILNNAGVTE